MLCAHGHQDVFGRHMQPATSDPCSTGLAVIITARTRRVLEQRRSVGSRPDFKPRRELGEMGVRRHRVQRQVQWTIPRAGRRQHVRPAADLARHQASARRDLVRAGDGTHGHGQRVGQVPLRWQPHAGRETSRVDVGRETVHQLSIRWSFSWLQPWTPYCHGDNITIDTIPFNAHPETMAVPLLQIDAFSRQAFGGNPAAVCLLEHPADAVWMQQVASEMNLAETAFVVPSDGMFGLRWFTPTVEVGLCGHATLASAHALWETGRVPLASSIAFETKSGILTAQRDGDAVAIELPARPVVPCPTPRRLLGAIGIKPRAVAETTPGVAHGNLLVELGDETEVRMLTPRFDELRQIPAGVIVTARGDSGKYDFISRYFAAPYGIDEDPVTGSSHCSLAPYWALKLGKSAFTAWQASPRGGELRVTLKGDRVRLAGHAITVLRGELTV
jgi:PhzF family phenazine biosynthesis protein